MTVGNNSKGTCSACALAACLAIACLQIPTWAASKQAPPAMQAALLVKLLALNKQATSSDSVVVYVVKAPEVAEALRKAAGVAIGTSRLAQPMEGSGKPGRKPTVVYIGDADAAKDLIAYTRENHVLSVTGVPELVREGPTLGVVVEDDMLKVYYNSESSALEGATWEAGLAKVVVPLK
jgi:hypothetical protein